MRTCTTMSYGWEIKLIKQNLINHANMKFGNGNNQENKPSISKQRNLDLQKIKVYFSTLIYWNNFKVLKLTEKNLRTKSQPERSSKRRKKNGVGDQEMPKEGLISNVQAIDRDKSSNHK